MTYTISTEPVTKDHIGRLVIARDQPTEEWREHILEDVIYIHDSVGDCVILYYVNNRTWYYHQALLIVDEADRKS